MFSYEKQKLNIDAKIEKFENLFFSFKNGKEYFYNYKIPAFQRNYSWELQNWKDFFQYLKQSIKTKRRMFWGIMIFANNDKKEKENKEVIVIDGQQRITTFSIFLLAFYQELKIQQKTFKSSKYNELTTKIEKIIYQNWTTKNFPKLNLNFYPEIDRKDYMRIVNWVIKNRGEDLSKINQKDQGQILKAFSKMVLFLRDFKSNNNNFELLLELLLEKSYFIIVTKKNIWNSESKDEHILKIFESLNATGKSLRLLEKIKNYLLFNLSYQSFEQQEKYINEHWQEFNFILTNKDISQKINSLESFFNVLCSIIYNGEEKINRINFYNIFKEYFFEFELIDKDIVDYDRYWINLKKLIQSYAQGTKKYLNQVDKPGKSSLNAQILKINQNYLFLHFEYEFMIFSFYFNLLLEKKLLELPEFEKLIKLISFLETILITIENKNNTGLLSKYNKILQKIISEEDEKLLNYLLKSEEESQIFYCNLNAKKFYQVFVEEFGLKETISKLLKENYSFYEQSLKNKIENDYSPGRVSRVSKLILEFINEDLLSFEEIYDLEHIIPKSKLKKINSDLLKNIGNVILIEKSINNKKIGNKNPSEKLEFYLQSKNKEIEKLINQKKSNFDWNEKDVFAREKEIFRNFFNKIRSFLKEYAE